MAVMLPEGEDLNEWVAVNSSPSGRVRTGRAADGEGAAMLKSCRGSALRMVLCRGSTLRVLKALLEQRTVLMRWESSLPVLEPQQGFNVSCVDLRKGYIYTASSNPLQSPAVDFFNQINMLYGTITDFCTEESCPVMSAGPKYEYHWADGTNIKKPIKCSAPKYIDYLMTWVQDQLDDETLFPSKIGSPLHTCGTPEPDKEEKEEDLG
ncbi:Mps one binder kinase activator-like 1A [Chelonia mydas]|uniref:Mps one binder kinase activator-like 1A n=1 Tax=Chelonia mydas TaxID=8469 RepID=M7BPN0_CHEMY|nr:Mps one binder kinase activator-like 1A [Chelonia mydas]